MNNPNALNIYQQNSVNTVSRERLLLMLFDGLTKFIKLAIAAVEENNIEKANNNFVKAQNIVSELMASLNMQTGGEISKSLILLYDYMHRRLVEANIKKDVAIANEVLGYVEEIKGAFEQASKLIKK